MDREISRTLLGIFDNASAELPADGTRIGVLESNQLVSETMSFLGGGPEETAYQFFKEAVLNGEQTAHTTGWGPGEKVTDFSINDVCFEIRFRSTVSLGAEYFKVRFANDAHPHYKMLEGDDQEGLFRLVFAFMKDNLTCKGCGEFALAEDFGICTYCKKHYFTTPCSVCGSHFGDRHVGAPHHYHST